MNERSDEELMEIAGAEGSEEAFSELFNRYWQRVVAYVGRLVSPSSPGEDLAQEVFVRMARYRHSYAPGRAFAPWLFQIARNLVLSSHRRGPERQIAIEDLASGLDTPYELPDTGAELPGDALVGAEARQIAARALASLEPELREVITLRLHEGWTFVELSRLLGITEDGARKRFLAGLAKLRADLSRHGLP